MEAEHLELARTAVKNMRTALANAETADGIRVVEIVVDGTAEARATLGLVGILLGKYIAPSDLERELQRIDSVLVTQLHRELTAGIDWDALPWQSDPA